MREKRKIYIVSENNDIHKNINNITKEFYKLEKCTAAKNSMKNSVILFDLTDKNLKNNMANLFSRSNEWLTIGK